MHLLKNRTAWAFMALLAATSLSADQWLNFGATEENHFSTTEGPLKTDVANLERSHNFQPSAYFPFVNTEPSITSQVVSRGNSLYYGDWTGAVISRNADTGAINWRTQLPVSGGRVQSTPLIDRNFIYVVQYDSTVLHKLNIHTGQILSSTKLSPIPDNETQWHKATGSPAVAKVNGKRLIIQGLDSDQNLGYLLDQSGNIVLNSFGKPAEKFTDQIAQSGQELFSVVGQIVAVNADTGEIVWRTATNNLPGEYGIGVWSTAAIDDVNDIAYIGSAQSYNPPASINSCAILKIDLHTGTILDRFSFIPNPVTRRESGVYSAAYPSGDPAIPSAFDPVGGDRDLAYYEEAEQPGFLGGDNDVGSAPVIYTANIGGENVPVVAAHNKAGRVRAFNRNTGQLLWEQVVSDSGGSILGNTGLAYENGKLFAAAVNDFTSNVRRGLDLSNPNFDPILFVSLLFQNIKINTTKLVAMDAATGQRLWANEPVIQGQPFAAPSVSNGVVYHVGFNSIVKAFDADTGVEMATKAPLGPFFPVLELPDLSDPDIPFCFNPNDPSAPCDLFTVFSIPTNSITFLNNSIFVGTGFALYGIGGPDGGVFKFSPNGS